MYECGMEEPTSPPVPDTQKNHCFEVDLIQETCTKVWVRINVHFFLDDNCGGTLDPLGLEDIPIEDAYKVAEEWVESANEQLGDLYPQWIQIPLWHSMWNDPANVKPAQCNPIRYALSGVYIHCDTNAKNYSL